MVNDVSVTLLINGVLIVCAPAPIASAAQTEASA